MDKSAETPSTVQMSTSTPPTDDESITTSTESDSLDTWTLITDKNKLRQRSEKAAAAADRTTTTLADNISDNRNEDLIQEKDNLATMSKDEGDDDTDAKAEEESNIDDFSDGISIISDSESAGRISPHPYLRDHLSNLNLKFSTGMEGLPSHTPPSSPIILPTTANLSEPEDQALRQRHNRRTDSNEKLLQRTDDDNAVEEDDEYEYEDEDDMHPLLRSSLTGLFYLCIVLSLLAFVVKLRYPEWNPFGGGKQLSVLEQKLNELELQNNLMRAEIDILSKQVNYLSTVDKNNQHRGDDDDNIRKYEKHIKRAGEWIMEQKRKAFKAWSGNGDANDPASITKKHLKRPFKCDNEKFIEVAGMCVEKQPHKDSLVNTLNKIGDIVEEKVMDGVQTLINGLKPESVDADGNTIDTEHLNENEMPNLDDYENKYNSDGDSSNYSDDDELEDEEEGIVEYDEEENEDDVNYMKVPSNKYKLDQEFINNLKSKGILHYAKEMLMDSFKIDQIKAFFGSNKRLKEKQYNTDPYMQLYSKFAAYKRRDCSAEHHHCAEHSEKENSKEHFNKDQPKEHFHEGVHKKYFHMDYSNRGIPKERLNKDDSKERFSNDQSAEHLNRREYKKRSDKVDSKEHFNKNVPKKHFNGDQSEKHFKKDRPRERFNNDQSEEHIHKARSTERKDQSEEHINKDKPRARINKDHSAEHFNTDRSTERFRKDHSKERHQNGERKKYGSGATELNDKSGEWHERLMQEREKIRRQNDINNKKNWYIERGDNREEMRHR